MRAAVYTSDTEFYVDFRNALLNTGMPDVIVERCESHARFQDFDLLVWDLDEFLTKHTLIPSSRPARELFAVSRKNARRFLDERPPGCAHIVLKPVSPIALKSFFETRSASSTDPSFHPQMLIECNLRLQEYEQDRTNFLARAVHDFRAPLTAAIGCCGLLKDEMLGPVNEEQMQVLGRMEQSLKKLTRMASAMLQLTAGNSFQAALQLKEASIEACINKAVQEIAPAAAEKKIGVTVDLTPPERPLEIDADRIEQALLNLLQNACKFTPRGGRVEVRAYPVETALGENSYRIDVTDSGAAVLPEHLSSIFEDYTSYDGHDRSGGGLGLALCKMIIYQHGGNIWAENPSKGARVSFVLPLKGIKRQRSEAHNIVSARAAS